MLTGVMPAPRAADAVKKVAAQLQATNAKAFVRLRKVDICSEHSPQNKVLAAASAKHSISLHAAEFHHLVYQVHLCLFGDHVAVPISHPNAKCDVFSALSLTRYRLSDGVSGHTPETIKRFTGISQLADINL